MSEVERVLNDLERVALGNERYVVEVHVYDCQDKPTEINSFRENVSSEWKYTDGLQIVKHISQTIDENEADATDVI